MDNDDHRLERHSGNPLMTVQEAADCLLFHPSTAYRLVRNGHLPALKLGKQWRVSRATLNRWGELPFSETQTNIPPQRGAQ